MRMPELNRRQKPKPDVASRELRTKRPWRWHTDSTHNFKGQADFEVEQREGARDSMTTSAVRYAILDRRKYRDFAVSGLNDFTLGDGEAFDSSRLLHDPRMSMYALDYERNSAYFVELSTSLSPATEPFFYLAQFNNATHLIAIPLAEFEALTARIDVDDSRLIFIQSVGRCGSTLLSRVFESVGSVRSLSEPDAFTNLVRCRASASATDDIVRRLIDRCVRTCCKPLVGSDAPHFVAIKFRSQCIEIDDLLAEAFPAAKHIYLTREPISWLDSSYRAFIDPGRADDNDYRAWIEDMFGALHPLIQGEIIEGKPMPAWKSSLLHWIANRDTFRKLQCKGIAYCVADFAEIKSNGMETIRRILDYCTIPIVDLPVIEACLSRDSQMGSGFEQSLINNPAHRLPEVMRSEARNLLAQYGYSVNE